jgi:hypothetical protein
VTLDMQVRPIHNIDCLAEITAPRRYKPRSPVGLR